MVGVGGASVRGTASPPTAPLRPLHKKKPSLLRHGQWKLERRSCVGWRLGPVHAAFRLSVLLLTAHLILTCGACSKAPDDGSNVPADVLPDSEATDIPDPNDGEDREDAPLPSDAEDEPTDDADTDDADTTAEPAPPHLLGCQTTGDDFCPSWSEVEPELGAFGVVTAEEATTRLVALDTGNEEEPPPVLLSAARFPELPWANIRFSLIDLRLTADYLLIRGVDGTTTVTRVSDPGFPLCEWETFTHTTGSRFACSEHFCVLSSVAEFDLWGDAADDEFCLCRNVVANLHERRYVYAAYTADCDERPAIEFDDLELFVWRAMRASPVLEDPNPTRLMQLRPETKECGTTLESVNVASWRQSSRRLRGSSTVRVGDTTLAMVDGGFLWASATEASAVEWADVDAANPGPGLAWSENGRLHVMGPDGLYVQSDDGFDRLPGDDRESEDYSGAASIDSLGRVWTVTSDYRAPGNRRVFVERVDGRTVTRAFPQTGIGALETPVVTNRGLLFYGGNGLVLVEEDTFDEIWRIEGPSISERPIIDDEGRMYVFDFDGVLSIWQTDLALADTPCPVAGCDFGYSNRVRDLW